MPCAGIRAAGYFGAAEEFGCALIEELAGDGLAQIGGGRLSQVGRGQVECERASGAEKRMAAGVGDDGENLPGGRGGGIG